MSWSLIGKPRTLKVTKALAKQYAEMERAPRDRPLSERRLQVYQRLLAQGLFRPVTWASAICQETGGVYRVNGKHTSTMLSGMETLPEFFVVVEDYECETLEDVAKLYSTFDSGMQSRTANDIYTSFAGTVPELSALNQHVIAWAVSGLAYAEFGTGVGKTTPAERAELLLDHADFAVWLETIVGRHEARHLQRQPVVAAMYGTWTRAKAAATEFWTAVRDETGSVPNVPDRKLSKYLLTTNVNRGGGSKWGVKLADNREIFAKCIHAWNAWRKGESTDMKYYVDKPLPSAK